MVITLMEGIDISSMMGYNNDNLKKRGVNMTDFEDRKVVLMDEDGSEHEFEVLDIIEVDGAEYAVLFPIEEGENDEEDEAIILKISKDENGEEVLHEIEDDEEWEKVADAYDSMAEDDEEEDED